MYKVDNFKTESFIEAYLFAMKFVSENSTVKHVYKGGDILATISCLSETELPSLNLTNRGVLSAQGCEVALLHQLQDVMLYDYGITLVGGTFSSMDLDDKDCKFLISEYPQIVETWYSDEDNDEYFIKIKTK